MQLKKTTEPIRTRRKTRLFALEYDNCRFETLSDRERLKVKSAEGTHYSNGCVTLDTGTDFTSMGKLQSHFNISGYYLVIYQDNGEMLTNESKVDRRPKHLKKARKHA